MKKFLRNNAEKIFLGFLLFLTFFLSVYRLAESPPTWFDEGFVIQSAVNLVESGKMGIQVAPGEIIRNSAFFSTGFTVTYPVGMAMRFFGRGLLQARAAMVLFLVLLVFFFYLLAKKNWGFKTAIFSSLLLASFAPLYGNGKNVLGEVPGLLFLILFLFFINKLEKNNFKANFYHYAMAGLAAGLCISTKPLFLVLIPAILLAFFIFKRNIVFRLKPLFISLLFFALPIVLWFKTQFSGIDSIPGILSTYSNPYTLSNIYSFIIQNALRFFTEATPIYFLVLLIIWVASIILRVRVKKQKIIIAEIISFIFVILVWLAYFRTPGWYRYLFPANVIMLLYFPAAFHVVYGFFKNFLFKGSKFKYQGFYKSAPLLLLLILISMQFYQVAFSSWVATYYNSTRTKELASYFNQHDGSKSIFVYRNPEIVTFLQHNNYYQYLKLNSVLQVGENKLNQIDLGVPDEIIATADGMEELNGKVSSLFLQYKEKDRVDKYVIFEKK